MLEIKNTELYRAFRCWKPLAFLTLLLLTLPSLAAPFRISVSNPSPSVTMTTAGQTAFFQNAGVLDDGSNTPISLRATLVSISAGDSITVFRSGDNPVVRANTGTLAAEVRWEVFNRNTGQPINGDPAFLITDIDGRNGNPIESVSAQCAGLTSYTVNGAYVPGVNANNSSAAQTNIRVTEINGSILAEGTQNQSGTQQEGYMQYNWTDVNSWVVRYFATTGGRWYVHDADGDIPFDGTQTLIDLVDLATIKNIVDTPTSELNPAPGENITYEIQLSNAGPANATGADITDILPSGLTLVSATSPFGNVVTAPIAGGATQIDWSSVAIPVGASRTLTIVATVDAGITPGTTLTNTTNTAQADQSKCSSRDSLTASFVVAEPPMPSLSLVKSAGTPTVASGTSATLSDGGTVANATDGDSITYSYAVTNTGNVRITAISPTDSGPTFNGSPGTNSLSAFSPASVDLDPGQSQTFTATYIMSATDVENLSNAPDTLAAIDNTASVVGTPVEGTFISLPSSSVETGFTTVPNATIVKSAPSISTNLGASPSLTDVGDVVNYSITITNTGNLIIDGARPDDPGPNINGAGRGGGLTGFTPSSVRLDPGQSQVFTTTYPLTQFDIDNVARAADPLTSIDNQARVQGDPRGPATIPDIRSNIVETGFTPVPAMTIVKSVTNEGSFSNVGNNIAYQWVVTNTGNVSMSNVRVTDSGPTFNGQPATNSLQSISPSNANLLPGQSQTFNANYILAQADIDNVSAAADPATAIDNTSTLTATPAGGSFAPLDSNTVETGFNVAGELTLSKTVTGPTTGLGANAALTDEGDTLTYNFQIRNTGEITVSTIAINDTGPSFNGVVGAGTLSSINCALTSLLPNQSTDCLATYTLDQADIDNAIVGGVNSVTNSATATGEEPDGDSVTSAASAATATITANSGVNVSKVGAAPTIDLGTDASITDPGDTVSYQITVENLGNTTLNNVAVTDSLTSVTCPALSTNGAAFVNLTGSLAPNDSVICTASYTIMQSDINTGQVINTASVSAIDPTGAPVSGSATENTGFTQKTSLSLTKVGGPPPTAVGQTVTYTFTLENTGNVSLAAPEISDPHCDAPATTLTRTVGYQSGDSGTAAQNTLDSDETWVFECTYTTVASDFLGTGEITNTATATGTPPSGLPTPMSSAGALVQAQQNVGIAVDKVAGVPNPSVVGSSSLVEEGDTVAYTFTVENTGNVELTAVTVSDPLITNQATNNTINCPLSVLPAGMSTICTALYTLTQNDVDAGMVSNTASVTGTPTTAVPIVAPSAMSGAMVTIPPSPSLTVIKSASAIPSNIVAGGTITYSYLVSNTGNVTINGVVPVDAGPTFNGVAAGASLVGFTPASADLAPNTNETFTATYAVTQDDLDNMAAAGTNASTAIDNTATATGTPENGVLAAVSPSTVETGVAPTPRIALVKTSSAPASVVVGQQIDYTFILTNTGNVSISNPTISDAQCQPSNTLSTPDSGDADNDGSLDVTETWVFTCAYAISQTDIDAGTVQNTATVSGQDPAGNNANDISGSAANNDTPTDTALARNANWMISKSSSSTPSRAGDTLDYRFVLNNIGNVSIANVLVNDPKCATPEVLESGDSNGDGVLTPDEVWTYSCTSIPVTQTEIDAGVVNNSVTASGSSPLGALANAVGNLSTPVTRAPALAMVKSVAGIGATTALGVDPNATDIGDQITYQYRVTNTGNTTLDNIAIVDAGPSFNSVAGTNNPLAAPDCGVPAPVLLPDDSVTCSVTYTLSQEDVDNAVIGGGDAVENSATASADDPTNTSISSPASTAATTIAGASAVSVLKTASAPGMTGPDGETIVGDTISYSITARNEGNTTLSNVTVSDDLAGVVVSCPSLTNENGDPFTNGSGNLRVGESVTCTALYSVNQENLNAGRVVNTARVVADDPAGTSVGAADEIITPITQNTSIELLKSASAVITPVVGEMVTYSFTLRNTGNVSLSDPQVSDPKCGAAPLTQAAASFNAGDLNNNNLLDSNETWLFSCVYTIIQSDVDLGRVENTATGTGTTPAGSGLPNPSSTANSIADIDQETGISVIKMAGVPTIANGLLNTQTDVGDTIDFTFEVSNTGNVTLDNITVSDPLITGAPNSQTINCPFTSLSSAAGATPTSPSTMSCTATYTITQADVDAGSVGNEASVIGDPPPVVPPADRPEASSSAMVGINPFAQLEISKTVAPIPSTIRAGDTITYSFEVQNVGNVTINNVAPTDPGPSFDGIPGTNSLSAFNTAPNVVNLAPNQTQIFTATYAVSQLDLDRVNAAADSSTAIDNTASVDGEPANGNLLPVTPSSAETGVITAPEITLVKRSVAPNPVVVGANVTYTFELENTGNVSISDPEISDAQCAVPGSRLTFSNGYVSGDTGQVGILDVDERWIFSCTYSLTQGDIDAGTVQNTAIAMGNDPSGSNVNDTSDSGNPADETGANNDPTNTALAQTAAWSVVKSTTSIPSRAGDMLDYRFIVNNDGNVSISSVVIVDPKCVATPALISGDADGNNVLTPNEVWTYTCTSIPVTQAEVDAGRVDNSVVVSGTPPPGVVLSAAANSLSTPIARTASWNVIKSTGSTPSDAGDTLGYSFEIRNTGNVSIGSVSVSDAKCAAAPVLASGDTNLDSRLDPVEVWTYTCTSIGVTQTEVDAGMVDNNVIVSGASPTGSIPNALGSVSTPIAANSLLSLVKTAAAPTTGFGQLPSATDADDTITYTFAVTNDGNVTIDNLVINDLGQTFNGVAGTGTLSAINCPLTSLSPGQNTSCSATYTLSQEDIDNAVAGGADAVENSATASGMAPGNVPVTSAGSTANTTVAAASSASIVKTAGAPTIIGGSDATQTDEGDTISYTLTIRNDGNTTLDSISIADTIAVVTCPGFNNGVDSLAPNASLTCSAIYTLTRADLDAGEVINQASVMGTDPTGALLGDDDQVTTGFTQRASILLTKSATLPPNVPPQAGDTISYTFELENTGNVSLSAPTVVDPNCGADLTTPDSGDTNANSILDADEIWLLSCTYTTDITDVNAGQVVNTAVGSGTPPVGSGLPEPQSTAGSLADLQQESSISLDKVAGLPTVTNGTLPAAVDAGGASPDTISYTFNIVNTGNVTLTNIALSDPLIINGSLSCPFTSLDPASAATPTLPTEMTCTATYSLTQADIDLGMVSNEAEVTADAPVNVPSPMGRSSAMVTLPPAPSLSIAKSASAIPANVADGTVITYSYVISNTGNTSINNVLPIDSGPTFNGVTASNALTAFTATTPSTSLPVSLAPGESQTFEATYTITQTDLDNMAAATNPAAAIDNTATATGTPSNGTLAPVIPSTVETGVAPTPALELIKSSVAPGGVPTVGSLINYSFSLQNIGNVTISNPTVSDAQCQAPGSVLSFGSGYVSGDAGQLGTLDVGETWTFACSYPVTQADLDAGTVQNTALAIGQDPAGNDVMDDSDSGNTAGGGDDDPTDTPLTQSANWNVLKSSSSSPSRVGDTLLYNFVISNTGNVSISNVAVLDAKCATTPVLNGGDIDGNNILAPTELWSYSCTSIGVTQAEVDAGQVDNSVLVSGTSPSGALPNAGSSNSTIIDSTPGIVLTKTALAPTVGAGSLNTATDVGDTIEYRFEIENTGNVTLNNISVNDLGTQFGGVAGTGSFAASACPVTSLAPGESTTCSGVYTPTLSDINNAIAGGTDSVSNTANATGTPPVGAAVTSPDSTATTTITPASALDIVKTAGAPTFANGSDSGITDPGDTITYTLDIENTGNTTINAVNVSDSIAAVSSCIPNTFVLGTDSLDPGETLSCTAIYSLNQADLDAGEVLNQALVEGTDPSFATIFDADQITTGFNQRTSIELLKSLAAPLVNNPAQLNDLITYEFTVENTGNVSLDDVELEDLQCNTPDTVLTRTTGYVSGDLNGDFALGADEQWTFNCNHIVTQDDLNAGGVVNTATATGTPPANTGFPPPTSTAGTLAELGQETGISLIKTGGQPTVANGALNAVVDAMDQITYRFAIENTGNVTLTNITLSDSLIPAGVSNCILRTTPPNTTVLPSIPDLNSGQIVDCDGVYTLNQTDVDRGMVNNTADVTGTPPASPPGSPPLPVPTGSSSAAVALPASPSMSVLKTVSVAIPDPVAANNTVTYDYLVTNTGNVTINNVLPVDTGPTFNGVVGTNTIGAFSVAGPASLPISLPPGESQVFSAVYTLSQSDIDNMAAAATPATAVDNTATAMSDPVNGSLQPVAPSIVETGVAGAPAMTLVKTSVAPVPATVGSLITYNFQLSNSGNVSITNPLISDVQCQLPGTMLSFGSGYTSGDSAQVGILDVGEVWNFSCSYALTQTDIDAGTVQNTALVTGQDPAGNNVPDTSDSGNPGDDTGGGSDPTNTPIARSSSWTVEKTTLSVPRTAGDTLVYDFTVRNTGNVSIANVAVSDPKCTAPITFVSGDVDINSVLTPNEVWVYRCTSIAVTQAEIDAGVVTNEVDVSGDVPPGAPALTNAQDRLDTPVVAMPSWMVIKSTTSIPTAAGDTLDYMFELINTGNVSIGSVAISDAKCASGPILNAATDIGADNVLSPAGTANVPPAETWTYTCTSIPVTQAEMNAGQVDNSVNVTGSVTSGALAPAGDSVSTFVTQTPRMSLVKSAGAGTVNSDGSLSQSFDFQLKNVGNVTLTGVTLSDDLTAQFGACFVGVDNAGVVDIVDIAPANDSLNPSAGGFPMIAEADALGVGDSLTLNGFTVRFDLNALGCVFPDPALNLATAQANSPAGPISDGSDSGNDPDTAVANDSGTPTPFMLPTAGPELGASKAASILSLNQDFTFDLQYTIVIRNTGNVDLSNLELFDDIAAQFGATFTPSTASDTTGGVIAAPVVTLLNDATPSNVVLPAVNPAYAGGAANLFDGSGVLGVGDTIQVVFSVRVDPTRIKPLPEQFENIADVSAQAPNGDEVEDRSNSGADPSVGAGGGSSPTIVTLEDVANLPIVLGQFRSSLMSDGNVLIEWQTQTEVANLGFNVYAKVAGEWQPLNAEIIPGKGDSVQVVKYQLRAQSNASSFALSDIDGRGVETLHGPFKLGKSYGKASERQATDWSEAIDRRKFKQQLREQRRRDQMLDRNRKRLQKQSRVGG